MVEYRVSAHLPESLLTWGKVRWVGPTRLVAGERASIEVETELAQALPSGHAIEAWVHFVSDIDVLQMEEPTSAAHFACRSEIVEIEPYVHKEGKVHGPGTFFPYRRWAGVRLCSEAVAGTRLHFCFSQVRMQSYEETLFNVRFAILKGEELVGYLGDAFGVIVGGAVQFLRVIAPTCVRTGEPFEARIVACDRFGNKSGDPLEGLAFDVAFARGPVPETAGIVYDADRYLHVVRGLRVEIAGVEYLEARLKDAPDVRGESNPIMAREEWAERVYWGEPHQHAYFADGRGTPAANYAYARSTACLDFCAVAPHQERLFAPGLLHLKDAPVQHGWEELVAATEDFNAPGFVTLLGSEAGSLGRVACHMNCYYLDPDNRPELERLGCRERQGAYGGHALPSYRAYLDVLESSKGEFLLLPHAHACGGPGRFDLPRLPAYQTNVEICSVHGVFEEFYAQWLAHGHHVGVHGGGDNHMTSTGNAHPGNHYPNTNGLTGLWSRELSRRGVWDGFARRKTYAVTGNQRIFLSFSVEGAPMGSVVPVEPAPSLRRIEAELAGTAPFLTVELLRNGQVICTRRPEPARGRFLRMLWTDDMLSRRTDDSCTTGRIALEGNGRLRLVRTLTAYNRTDRFLELNGTIAFRSNAYSGTPRGAIVEVLDGAEGHPMLGELTLRFEIEDVHQGRLVLCESFQITLHGPHAQIERLLDLEERHCRPCFTQERHHPRFRLDVDRIALDWPRVLALRWEDPDLGEAYYYLRAEQIDGNMVWSSPVWFGPRPDGIRA